MALLDNISDEILLEFRSLRMTYDEIADTLGVSRSVVYNTYVKRRLNQDSRKLENIDNRVLIEYRKVKKMSYSEIGEVLGVSANTVSNEYKARGINIEVPKVSNRILADKEDKEFIRLRESRMTYQDIADHFNVSKSLIIKEFKLRNIETKIANSRRKLVSIDDNLLKNLRESKKTYEEISELLGVSIVNVHSEYKQRGLKDSQ